jgi:hypothetical protein
MDDHEKQDHVEVDPFKDLAAKLGPENMVNLIQANSIEEVYERIAGLLGEEMATQMMQQLEAMGYAPQDLLPTEEDWILVERFRRAVAPKVGTWRTNGLEHNARVSALSLWAGAMAALREARFTDEFDLSNEDDVLHVCSHATEAVFAMAIVAESYGIDWTALKEGFFNNTKTMVKACNHASTLRELVDFETGIAESWSPEPVLEVLASDLVGMSGLLTHRYDNFTDELVHDVGEQMLGKYFDFQYARRH